MRDAVIVIDNGRFVAAGRRSDVTLPAGAREINAQGKFIIPGLMDANVHLILGSSIEFIVRHEDRYEDLIEEAAQIALKNGLTTVFDSWGPLQPLLNVRDRIKRGETVGSRMYVAGNIVGFSGPFGREFNRNAETTASKKLVSRINAIWEENVGQRLLYMDTRRGPDRVRKYIGRGIDFLKYGASTHNNLYLQFSPGGAARDRRRMPPRRDHRADAHDERDEPEARDRGRQRHAAALRRQRSGFDP